MRLAGDTALGQVSGLLRGRGRWCRARGPQGSAAAPFRRRPLRPPTPRARLSAVQRRPARDPLAPSAHTSRLDRGRQPLQAAPVLSYGARSAHRPQPGTASRLSPSAGFRPPGASRPSADPRPLRRRARRPARGGLGRAAASWGWAARRRRGAPGGSALLLALVAAGTPAGAYNLDPQRPVPLSRSCRVLLRYAVLGTSTTTRAGEVPSGPD